LRRNNPTLQQLRQLHFHDVDNATVMAYSKADTTTGNVILVVINLDPRNAQEATVTMDYDAVGLAACQSYPVDDLFSGMSYESSENNFVGLGPLRDVAHIYLLPRVPRERREALAYRHVTDYRP